MSLLMTIEIQSFGKGNCEINEFFKPLKSVSLSILHEFCQDGHIAAFTKDCQMTVSNRDICRVSLNTSNSKVNQKMCSTCCSRS